MLTEDEELELALAMSVEGNKPASAPSSALPQPAAATRHTHAEPVAQPQKPAATEQAEAASMPNPSKEENIFAAANGADQVIFQFLLVQGNPSLAVWMMCAVADL